MRSLTRALTAGITTLGLTLAASPVVMAQDAADNTTTAAENTTDKKKATGSSEMTASLDQAGEALHGPVKLTRKGDTLTVAYTNKTDAAQKCSGLVLPFDSVKKTGLMDLDIAKAEPGELLEVIAGILEEGNSSVFGFDLEGNLDSASGEQAAEEILLGLSAAVFKDSLPDIAAGATQAWDVTLPTKDAVAIVLCDGDVAEGVSPKVSKGIEQSIFFDQMKDKLGPAGSAVDMSSKDDKLAGSLINGIPFLSAFIKVLQILFGGIMNLLGIKTS